MSERTATIHVRADDGGPPHDVEFKRGRRTVLTASFGRWKEARDAVSSWTLGGGLPEGPVQSWMPEDDGLTVAPTRVDFVLSADGARGAAVTAWATHSGGQIKDEADFTTGLMRPGDRRTARVTYSAMAAALEAARDWVEAGYSPRAVDATTGEPPEEAAPDG